MESRALPSRQLPHQSKLAREYFENFSRVAAFYEHPPTITAISNVARKLEFPDERIREVAAALRAQNEAFGAGSATLENLARLEKGAVAIVSGQQVGLFSGPAYSFYKALTAIQVAEELTRSGVEAVPVFWMATEDHDVDEVRGVNWFKDGKLARFELAPPPAELAGRPVGKITLGPQIREAAHEAAELLVKQGSTLLAQFLGESYRPEETYGSAFGKLFTRMFAKQGLILLDPLDPRLHKVAARVYEKSIADRNVLNEQLLQRGKDLEKAGFDAQVKVTSRSTLLFYLGAGARQAITANGAKYQAGEKSWDKDQLIQEIRAHPENFSPSALFRAVVQDYLLPTAAYIGGPAEISYFAQSQVVYKQVLGRMPVIVPRPGFTLVDIKAEKLLRTYKLSVEEIWKGPEAVRQRMEARSVPKDLYKEFDYNQRQVERSLGRLDKQIMELDPTLRGAIETARKKIAYQLEKLRRKSGRAADLKTGLLVEHEEFLQSLLYPHKSLQSRELCLLPFLARWGAAGLGELQKMCGAKNFGKHFIISLP